MSTPDILVVSQVRKELVFLAEKPEIGELIFTQRWWLDPYSKLGEHLHEGMAEVIGMVRGSARMLVWLQEGMEAEDHELESGSVVFVPTGCRHSIINATENEALLSATGIKTREGGQTIRFE